jgi:hypothetical protein
MKKLLNFLAVLLFFGLSSTDPAWNYSYLPVLMDIEDLRQSVSFEEPRPMKETGKIYIKGNHLFVSEKYEGVHVFDNTDPKNPQNMGFIKIPGCMDMAVKGTILYADNAIDLVAIDISSPNNPAIRKRVENAFPEIVSPEGYIPHEFSKGKRPDGTVIVGWERTY